MLYIRVYVFYSDSKFEEQDLCLNECLQLKFEHGVFSCMTST